MSWDIHVQDFGPYKSLSDIPDDFQPQPLGPKSEIISKIQQIAPQADFSDPTWGLIEAGNGSIEINIGDEDPCQSFMLHVRGRDDAVPVVISLLRHLNLRAFDMQTGEFLEASAARDSFEAWSAYRDQIVSEHAESSKPSLLKRMFDLFR